MITYVTCDDVDNAFGNAWTSENAKNKAVLMANAWLNGFNLKINPSRIPEEVKLAGAYAARIASFGKLFQQKNDSGVVISKAVSANLHGMITGMAEDLQSLVGGTVVRRKVYARFLDAVNFVNGNSEADPEQEVITAGGI